MRLSSLLTQLDVWNIEGLNGPADLELANGDLYFINDGREIRRIRSGGSSSETVFTASSNTVSALAISPAGATTPTYVVERDGQS